MSWGTSLAGPALTEIDMLTTAATIGARLLGVARSLTAAQLLCLALVALSVFLFVQRNDARSDATRWEGQFRSERAARLVDRASYENAQKVAGERNRADVARVEAEQERINDESTRTLSDRLERLRRELQPRSATPQGAAGRADLPADGAPSGGVDEAARLCLAPDELLRGAESEERHDQLISWVERQLGVAR